jgi:hypothetical protein
VGQMDYRIHSALDLNGANIGIRSKSLSIFHVNARGLKIIRCGESAPLSGLLLTGARPEFFVGGGGGS